MCSKLEAIGHSLVHCRGFHHPDRTVLYTDLLPFLSHYRRVFLMDEDISLAGFDIRHFTTTWDCAFHPQPAPLIVQPLIAESNQYIPFVNSNRWTQREFKNVTASAAGLVEQQVPLFDAQFFDWFVRHVLSLTYDYALHYGVDWGHDRSWCNAARLYATEVLGYSDTEYTPCAVLVKTTPVHHLNGHTMKGKKENREQFHRNAVVVVQRYIDLFPTWVVTDLVSVNPLDAHNEHVYKRATTPLSEACVSEHAVMVSK
eukprot:gene21585-27623_t